MSPPWKQTKSHFESENDDTTFQDLFAIELCNNVVTDVRFSETREIKFSFKTQLERKKYLLFLFFSATTLEVYWIHTTYR